MRRAPRFLLTVVLGLACHDPRKPVGPSGAGGDAAGGAGGGADDAGRDAGGPDLLPPPVDAGPPNACMVDSDCTWGEIDHEILSRADCVCLLGCPHIEQNKATTARRMAQYQALCTPGRDANGNPCPVDDCVVPPPLHCVSGAGICAPPGA